MSPVRTAWIGIQTCEDRRIVLERRLQKILSFDEILTCGCQSSLAVLPLVRYLVHAIVCGGLAGTTCLCTAAPYYRKREHTGLPIIIAYMRVHVKAYKI